MTHKRLINKVYGPGGRMPTQEQETALERKIAAILTIAVLFSIILVSWGTVIVELLHLKMLGAE